jgi:sialic acid synthase SpsE
MDMTSNSSLYIIAECAQGYSAPSLNESINLAEWLVKSAKAAGADAVKFQLIIADELACPDYKYYDLFRSLEIGVTGWKRVADLAKAIDIDLLFDIFGLDSLSAAIASGADGIKIHPTDFTNTELLGHVASAEGINHVIAGCGGATQDEIEHTMKLLSDVTTVTLLHGFQGYPTPRFDNCLRRLSYLSKYLNQSRPSIRLGFADHSDPTAHDATHLPAVALGFGVSVIEKHLTLARCLELEDHESALSPDEFCRFIEILQDCQEAYGPDLKSDSFFEIPQSEINYRKMIARHVTSVKPIDKAVLITPSDVCLKRSSNPSAITDLSSVIGRRLNQSVNPNTPITPSLMS